MAQPAVRTLRGVRRRAWSARWVWRIALVLGLLVAVSVNPVQGLLTDTVSVPANTFSVSVIDISTSVSTALVTFSGMLPGDSVTAPITVTNAGSAQLGYASVRSRPRTRSPRSSISP